MRRLEGIINLAVCIQEEAGRYNWSSSKYPEGAGRYNWSSGLYNVHIRRPEDIIDLEVQYVSRRRSEGIIDLEVCIQEKAGRYNWSSDMYPRWGQKVKLISQYVSRRRPEYIIDLAVGTVSRRRPEDIIDLAVCTVSRRRPEGSAGEDCPLDKVGSQPITQPSKIAHWT